MLTVAGQLAAKLSGPGIKVLGMETLYAYSGRAVFLNAVAHVIAGA
jgi:hypothetical protein